MHFNHLCSTYTAVSNTSKRLEKTVLLASLLRATPEKDMHDVMLLIQGRVFPTWDRTTLGVSQKIIIKALVRATGKTEKEIVTLFKQTGDLGEVAAKSAGKKTQATLTSKELSVEDVLTTVQKLSTIEGEKSVDRKLGLITSLLSNASAEEARFIIRIVLEDLRIGIAEGTVRDAIIQAFGKQDDLTYNPEENTWTGEEGKLTEWRQTVQDAIDRSNDLARVAITVKNDGLASLRNIQVSLGTPVRCMLAQRSTGIEDAFDRVGTPAAVEYKYDGFRMQIHVGKEICLFTRRLEDVTLQFPDVVSLIKQYVKQPCILDAEVVGIDKKTGRHLPFQNVSQRIRRKYDIEKLAQELPVEVNVFDILLLEKKHTYEQPFMERRKLVEHLIPTKSGKIQPSTMILTSDEKEVEPFYKDALNRGFEGLMFKSVDAPYKPGSRVGTMVKLKPTLDTLDVVVVKAEWGEGKRSGWLTSFTVAIQNDAGDLVEIGKVGTGFKELEQEEGVTFQQMTDLLKEEIVEEIGKEVHVRPKVVIELKFEEIQKSPSYSSGFALRFPRMVGLRSDRRADEISSESDVLDLYDAQRGRKR